MTESPFQQLICLGIAALENVPNRRVRAEMLRAAAPHLPDEMAERCVVTAGAIDIAERAQMELRDLLLG